MYIYRQAGYVSVKKLIKDRYYIAYQQFISMYMYDGGRQICCNWSRLKLAF